MRDRTSRSTVIPETSLTLKNYVTGQVKTKTVPAVTHGSRCVDDFGSGLAISHRHWDLGGVPSVKPHSYYSVGDKAVPLLPVVIDPLTPVNPLVPYALETSRAHRLGADAISRSWPTNPTAEAATFVAESYGKLFDLPGTALKKDGLHGGSGEFLNYQFGIAPLVSDVKKFAEAGRTSTERIDQLVRDSDRQIKRRRKLGSTSTSTSSVRNLFPAGYSNYGLTSYEVEQGTLTTTTTETEDIWFAGKFSYHIPERLTRGVGRQLLGFKYSWGATPGLDTAWNALPFSWAVDYFANVGSVVTNLQRLAEGNRLMDAYVMVRKSIVTEYTWTGNVAVDAVPDKTSIWGRRTTWRRMTSTAIKRDTLKFRYGASPFGFGLSAEDFTPMQASLLAAVAHQQTRR